MAESELPIFPFDTPPELDAEPEYVQLRREDPVPKVRLPMGGVAYLASRYEDVKRVFTAPVFSRAATSDRGVAQPQPVDFVAAFAAPLPALVISEMLGGPVADGTMLRGWLDVGLSITAHTPQEIQAAGEQLFGYIERLIAAKRVQPADDLLTRMIQARDEEDRLSEPELVNNAYVLISGGYETTATLLANSLLTLHRHPEQLAMLRDKPELIPDAVEELLRYVRLAPAILERVATQDVQLSGTTVPAGST